MSATEQPLWLVAVLESWRSNKELADKAIAQLDDGQLRRSLDPSINSVAVVMKHVAGNLRSRWTHFLTTDGEKPSRRRDREFVDDYTDRQAMLEDWESGWAVLFEELEQLTEEDCTREVTIRGHKLSVPLAIMRSLAHCAYHVGQIVQTARAVAGDDWRTLTVPRGGSEEYNSKGWGDASPRI